MAFELHRGVNFGLWLSQSKLRGAEREALVQRTDVQNVARLGFDHIRLPVDEEQLWDATGRREPEAWRLMDRFLDWALEAGLRVIIDLHILRSHYFNQKEEPRLFTDPAEAQRLAALWIDLSDHLCDRPTDAVAYEYLNEAVARENASWNRVAGVVYRALREREPERVFVLGSNRWQGVDTFADLEVPDDPHQILSFHFYEPGLVTHYRASWTPMGGYAGPIQYPGRPIPEDAIKDFVKVMPEAQEHLEQVNQPYDRLVMIERMGLAMEVAKRNGLPLYCGEFACIEHVPWEMRLAWYRDVVAAFQHHGIAYAHWGYKRGRDLFWIVEEDGTPSEIVDILLGSD